MKEAHIGGILKEADEVAIRLDQVVKSGRFSPIVWPTSQNLGENFARLVLEHLCCTEAPAVFDSPNLDPSWMNKMWEMTKRWRMDSIQAAIDVTSQDKGIGLRRTAIFDAVSRDLGVVANGQHEFANLLERRLNSREETQALYYFCYWVTTLYQFNQVSAFKGASSNIPNYDPIRAMMYVSLDSANLIWDINDQLSPPEATIQQTVVLPPLEVMMQVPPSRLLDIRQEWGSGYLAALTAWQRTGDERKEEEVCEKLRKYAEQICLQVSQEVPTNFESVYVLLEKVNWSSNTQRLSRSNTAETFLKACYLEPTLAFNSISKDGSATYVMKDPRNVSYPVRLRRASQANTVSEINLAPRETGIE